MEPAVLLRPMAAADADELRAIHLTPEVREWWGSPEEGFPESDEPEATRFTIVVDERIAGLIQYAEETHPDYRHASIDIFLDPALRGRGLGTEALRLLVRQLIDEGGHHRITIDPASENAPAIRSYEKVGFVPVGVMRAAWRDEDGAWRDTLLMELVDMDAISRT